MPKSSTTQRPTRGFEPVLVVLALVMGGLPLFCCVGSWIIRLVYGPRDEPSLVRHFHANRADFDGFVAHYRGLEKGAYYKYPKSFDIGGLGYEEGHYPRVMMEDDCVLLDWRWGPPQSCDEYLVHSPRGLEGIPSKYRESTWADGTPRYRITPIDDTWFYMLEP